MYHAFYNSTFLFTIEEDADNIIKLFIIDPSKETVIDKTPFTEPGIENYRLNVLLDDSMIYHKKEKEIIY